MWFGAVCASLLENLGGPGELKLDLYLESSSPERPKISDVIGEVCDRDQDGFEALGMAGLDPQRQTLLRDFILFLFTEESKSNT